MQAIYNARRPFHSESASDELGHGPPEGQASGRGVPLYPSEDIIFKVNGGAHTTMMRHAALDVKSG